MTRVMDIYASLVIVSVYYFHLTCHMCSLFTNSTLWNLFSVLKLTLHFGNLDADALAAMIHIHVLILSTQRGDAMDTAVAFSFPLCGSTDQDL